LDTGMTAVPGRKRSEAGGAPAGVDFDVDVPVFPWLACKVRGRS
jgi:hypothetical protein